jgi:hypothetical protein
MADKSNQNKAVGGKPAAGTNRVRRNKPVYVIKPPPPRKWWNRNKDT